MADVPQNAKAREDWRRVNAHIHREQACSPEQQQQLPQLIAGSDKLFPLSCRGGTKAQRAAARLQ